jgi:hypothetical protein
MFIHYICVYVCETNYASGVAQAVSCRFSTTATRIRDRASRVESVVARAALGQAYSEYEEWCLLGCYAVWLL